MKTTLLRSFVTTLAVVCLTLCFRLNVVAGTTAPADLLTQAYLTLSVADHDYKGHRVEAMKQIEAAGKLLGVDVHGDGKVHEKQAASDEQVRAALALLQQAVPGLTGKPLNHTNRAIKQLTTALTIK